MAKRWAFIIIFLISVFMISGESFVESSARSMCVISEALCRRLSLNFNLPSLIKFLYCFVMKFFISGVSLLFTFCYFSPSFHWHRFFLLFRSLVVIVVVLSSTLSWLPFSSSQDFSLFSLRFYSFTCAKHCCSSQGCWKLSVCSWNCT